MHVALCKEVPTITSLSLAGIGLGDAGVASLAKALKHTKPPLLTLDLSNNAIGVEGCRALADALPSLESLEVLVLHGDPPATTLPSKATNDTSLYHSPPVSPTFYRAARTQERHCPRGVC